MEHEKVLYGGIIARSPSYVEEDTSETPKGRKTRKRKSVNDEDETSSGKRGRPRVDVKDQNAIEVCKLNHMTRSQLTRTRGDERKYVLLNGRTANERSPPSTLLRRKSSSSKRS